MEKLEVGGKFSLLAGQPEGTFFEITESGPVWFFNYLNPTNSEVAAMSAGSSFEIRTMELGGVLWIFVKCGGQPWTEAPYNPHLSKSPALNPIDDDVSGYMLTLVMVDAATRTIRHIRTIGLGNKFSRQLKISVDSLLASPFDRIAYFQAIQNTQNKYATAQMAKIAKNYWRLR